LKKILKGPFENLMKRAIKEIRDDEYNSKAEALSQLKLTMTILINDLANEKYEYS